MECVEVWCRAMDTEQEKMTRISATIPEPVAEQFKDFCKKQRRSVSAQITLLMEQALREVEKNASN